MRKWMNACAAMICAALLAGCMHTVPAFKPGEPEPYVSAPTVTQLAEHIVCELRRANASEIYPGGRTLSAESYTALVTLLVQVDDTVGTTPSIAYTELLKSPATSLVTTLGLDVNAQRKRTFTTTYTVDIGKVVASAELSKKCGTKEAGERRYDLRGNLGINEIVADGFAIRAVGDGVFAKRIKETLPTFGSQVQFIVTRGVSGVGPIWTLRYWKGPSSAAGLFNGKQLYTNSAIFVFSPKLDSTTPALVAGKALETARAARADAVSKAIQLDARLKSLPKSLTPSAEVLRLEGQAADARAKVAESQRAVDQAAADLAEAQRTEPQREAEAARDAAAASRDLLNTMLLQNLPNR